MYKIKVLSTRLLLAILVIIALEALVYFGTVSPLILSRPTAMGSALWQELVEGEVPRLFLATMIEVAIAFALSAILGFGAGYLLWRYERWGVAYETILGAVFSSPLVLVYPIFLVVFSRNPAAVVAMGFLSGYIPMVLGVRDGLLGVSRTLVRVGESLNLSRSTIFWKIQLPAAAPTIFTGLRLGFTYAFVNIIAVEFLAEIGGLGKMVSASYFRFQIDKMYAGIGATIVLTVIFIYLTYKLQRRVK